MLSLYAQSLSQMYSGNMQIIQCSGRSVCTIVLEITFRES